MEATYPPRVKICCVAGLDEVRLAVRHGAAAVGLVSAMPSGPGVIPDALSARLAAAVPPPVAAFLLTALQDARAIVALQRRVGATALQLVDKLPPGAHAALRAALPGTRLVQVVHVTGEEAIAEALAVAPAADALLLDTGDRRAAVKALGGTGRVHDWALSRRIREAVPGPVFLAGGLTPENVRRAIDQVGPFGVDVCTGVRTAGRLDEAKLARFMAAVRATAAA